MATTLELCNHVHNYDRLACYFLSSIVRHPPDRAAVTVTVCYSPEDVRTAAVLEFFGSIPVRNVTWNWKPYERKRLCQRAIGRNDCALATTADFLMHGDVDYLYGAGAIDAAADAMTAAASSGAVLMFPRIVLASKSHALGDAAIAAVEGPSIVEINQADFHAVRLNRAVGGVQWVTGDIARSRGYMPGSRFQRSARRWMRTHSDTSYRRSLGTKGKAIAVPGIYRIRHGARGRKQIGVRL